MSYLVTKIIKINKMAKLLKANVVVSELCTPAHHTYMWYLTQQEGRGGQTANSGQAGTLDDAAGPSVTGPLIRKEV